MRAKITLQVKETAASRRLRMNLRHSRSFHQEFYETFLNFYVSVGVHVMKIDQNFRTAEHPQKLKSPNLATFKCWFYPPLGQTDELLELAVNLPNEIY